MKIFTPEDVETAIADDSKLMALENYVVDVKGYEKFHPGGRFILDSNIGNDIGKFIYGGYFMINPSKGKSPG